MSTTASSSLPAPDLRQRAPRSLRCRLGGFALLPRLLDKCRATIAGTAGEYHYACPLDQQFLTFVGLDPAVLKAEVARGGTDSEVLAWIQQHARNARQPWEISEWSAYQETRQPSSDPATNGFFISTLAQFSKTRNDVHSWADLLDLDDHCSFGGTA